jgi:hypothetical protein
VLTIPATRPVADDKTRVVFSEAPAGQPPPLRFWFPAGETRGYEFVNAPPPALLDRSSLPPAFQSRADADRDRTAQTQSQANAADAYAVQRALQQIERGKFGAARDSFRRNYFLANNRDGASVSFLLALLMRDRIEAYRSFDLVKRFDPERARALKRLDVNDAIESLPAAGSNVKSSQVRRFLFNFALDRTDDPIARTAVLSFERHVVKGDSYPVEIALDRERELRDKERKHQLQWVLAKEQIAKLSDCVKSLLNHVGALEYSASFDAKFGTRGSVSVRVVLTQRRLDDLDAIMERSHLTISEGRSKLERLISRKNAAIARELDALRSSLRELDGQPRSSTGSQFASLRRWDTASPAAVARDLVLLAEIANQPYMRASNAFRTNRGYIQISIAASLVRIAEWTQF